MEKSVIFAEDSNQALKIVTKRLGTNAIILETKKVKGGVEVIAGIPSKDETNEPEFRRALRMTQQKVDIAKRKSTALLRTNPLLKKEHLKIDKDIEIENSNLVDHIETEDDNIETEDDNILNKSISEKEENEDAPENISADPPPYLEQLLLKINNIEEKLSSQSNPKLSDDEMFLLNKGFSPEVVSLCFNDLEHQDSEDNEQYIYDILWKKLCTAPKLEISKDTRIITVCGPSGAGKTLSLIRLATSARVKGIETCVMTSSSSCNRASHERIKHAGKVLDTPLIQLPDECEISRLKSLIKAGATLFIDAPAGYDDNIEQLTKIQGICDSNALLNFLIIPAGYGATALSKIIEKSNGIVDNAIITKTDETAPDPSLLNVLLKHNIKIAGITSSSQQFIEHDELTVEMLEEWINPTSHKQVT